MKWSHLSRKQQFYLKIGLFVVIIASNLIANNKKDKKKFLDGQVQITVLEKWSYGDSHNMALLVSDSALLNKNSALEIVSNYCELGCSNVYFYSSKEAYDLHAYKRTVFGTSSKYGSNVKKLVADERKWKSTNGNWKTVKDNLIATVSFGAYQPYPYRNEED